MDEDTTLVINAADLLDNDFDADQGDEIGIVLFAQPDNGTVVSTVYGSVYNEMQYTPNPDFVGMDEFTYTIEDESGARDTARIRINVGGINDIPAISSIPDTAINEDEYIEINFTVNDTETNLNDLDIYAVSSNTVLLPIENIIFGGSGGNRTVNLIPNHNKYGSTTIRIYVNDGFDEVYEAFTLTVNSVNDLPSASNDNISTAHNTPVTIDVLANDSDVDGDILSLINATQGDNGAVVINPDNTVTYTPNNNFSGTDSFEYTISDENGGENEATVTVNVNAPRDDDDDDDDNHRNNQQPRANNTGEAGLEDIYVNGEQQEAASTELTEENGQSVMTVTIDDAAIRKVLQEQGDNSIITIPASAGFDSVAGILNGKTLALMKEKNTVLEIKAGDVTYRLPANEINMEELSEALGQNPDLEDIHIKVEIKNCTEDTLQIIQDTADRNNYQILVKPLEFKVTCTHEDQEVEITRFNGYIERMIEIPEGIDPNKVTTGIILNQDGTFTHVPTSITVINGKTYAVINSLTNSAYSVIYNPVKVAAVENHWSKVPVNDMASRLVIENPQTFVPDGEITRGEFAEYITKALGLYRTGAAEAGKFKDVQSGQRADAVTVAVNNGIINGYPDNTFKPEAKITREEAMTMYARAMDIVKLMEINNNRITAYQDEDQVSPWAYDSVKKTISVNIFNGRTSERIVPKGMLTYSEAATAIRNLLIEAGLINQ
jgi:hypothetical protein